jgi:hypothetical protein
LLRRITKSRINPENAERLKWQAKTPRALIDRAPMSRFQWGVVAVIIGLNALDGFDVLSISFASPGIAKAWGIDRAALGLDGIDRHGHRLADPWWSGRSRGTARDDPRLPGVDDHRHARRRDFA